MSDDNVIEFPSKDKQGDDTLADNIETIKSILQMDDFIMIGVDGTEESMSMIASNSNLGDLLHMLTCAQKSLLERGEEE